MGAAQASDWPSLQLTASGGLASAALGDLLRSAARGWSLAGLLSLPVFDGNLKSLAVKTRAECVIAHVRGVAYSTTVKVSEQNTHPFHFPGAAVAMAVRGHRLLTAMPNLRNSPAWPSVHSLMPYLAMV